ncbi:unnamed protein product [Allacma fusca]|uniref:Immunoglobulin domain-containing protein n=1 Tax=Allacma fusca TaxID=39272 RepID=A0A8J2PYQ8_9HEXA|nr:unnamed protein product [Allacma fusca]
MWSLFVGWTILSFAFYLFSLYVGWEWVEKRLRNTGNSNRGSHTSTNWSFAAGQPRTNTRVITNNKVRDYIEHLVTKQLGGSPPEVSTVTSSTKPQHCDKYDKLFHNYHEKLTTAVVDLGKSLHLRPPNFDNEGTVHMYSQPATETAEENFSKLLVEVKDAAMDLAPFEDDQTFISKSVLDDGETVITNVLSSNAPTTTTYEEILSTAILNKVVNDIGLGGGRKSLSPVISVVDSAVQTDNDGELSATGSGKYNVKSWVTTTDGFSNFSDDDISLGTSSSNWSGGDGINPPVVQQIEEHVEITYETNETDSDTSQDESSRLTQQQRPRKTNNKKTKNEPVPFPEHGVDIVDSPDENDEDEPSKKVSQVAAWEENWLFKKKKKPILFSKMAAESVPMLVPNPSATDNDDNEEDKQSDIEDDDFIGDYFEFPGGGDNQAYEESIDIKWPEDAQVATGKTARFSVTLSDAENAPPIWRSLKTKRILTSQSKKIEIKASPPKYTLIMYDPQESDAGEYEVVVRNESGSEISHSFSLSIKPSERKKVAPSFNTIPDIVRVTTSTDPVTIDFEIAGHPEPVVNIFKGSDIITSIDDKGSGRWTLTLNRTGTKISQNLSGEYIAVATNTLGTTRVVFRIEDSKDGIDEVPVEATEVVETYNGISVRSQGDDDNNSTSSSSPAEETLKETSQSLVLNDTLELEDQDDPTKRFTVAEREKMKWANPVKLDFNPYAPENLAKRIRAGRTSRDLVLGATNMADDDEKDPDEDSFLKTDKRDFKTQSTPEPKIILVQKPWNTIPSDLGGVKLPSVKQLAQQFSPVSEKTPTDFGKPLTPVKDIGGMRGIQFRKKFDTMPSRLPSVLPKSPSSDDGVQTLSSLRSRASVSPPRTHYSDYDDDLQEIRQRNQVQNLARKFYHEPNQGRSPMYLPPRDMSTSLRPTSSSSSEENLPPASTTKIITSNENPVPVLLEETNSPDTTLPSSHLTSNTNAEGIQLVQNPEVLLEQPLNESTEEDNLANEEDTMIQEHPSGGLPTEEKIPTDIIVEARQLQSEPRLIEEINEPIESSEDTVSVSTIEPSPKQFIAPEEPSTPSSSSTNDHSMTVVPTPAEEPTLSQSASDTDEMDESFVFIPPLPKTPPPKPRLSSSNEAPFMLITDPNGVVQDLLAIDEEQSLPDAEVFEDNEGPEVPRSPVTSEIVIDQTNDSVDDRSIENDSEGEEFETNTTTTEDRTDKSEASPQDELDAQLEEAKRIESETLRKLTRQIVRQARFRKGGKMAQEEK